MFRPKPRARRVEFIVRVFMADISTKDGSAVKKIHLNSTGRRSGRCSALRLFIPSDPVF